MFFDFANRSASALRENGAQWLLSFSNLLGAFGPAPVHDPASACVALLGKTSFLNTTILNATYFAEPASALATLGTCAPTADVSVPLCRAQFVVNTSETSSIKAEIWLPDDWSGRFLALGNGGLGGCIDYGNLNYGSSLRFATVASNNGHDGNTGEFFLDNPEVLNDFTHRSIHVETLVGKQIVEAYYGRPHKKSFYLGCSTGGRQGVLSALRYPEDFDGIVAGAPATNFNNLLGYKAMIVRHLGGPNATASLSPSFIPQHMWDVFSSEILRQCDELDGVKDGIITEPDECVFRPETLLCNGKWWKNCLTVPQVEALRKLFEPSYGSDGRLLCPRYDPGAEAHPNARALIFSGEMYYYSEHWWKYAIYNDSKYDFTDFGLKDVEVANKINPGGVAAYSGDMAAFKARGGKLLSYHGRRDELIPSGNAKDLYNLVSRTLGTPSLDSFYRLFLIPGMDHCSGGPGAVNFGQYATAVGPVKAPSHNILLALVDWVEKSRAPDTIIGTSVDGKKERVHCRYPQSSVWNGSVFQCAV